jgi:hypothetical protein
MPLKCYYMDSYLDTFSANLGTICDEHEKHFNQETSKYSRGRILSCRFFSIIFDFHLKRLPQVFPQLPEILVFSLGAALTENAVS